MLRAAYLDGVTGSLLLSSKNTLLTYVPLKLIENTRVHLTRDQESFQNVTPQKKVFPSYKPSCTGKNHPFGSMIFPLQPILHVDFLINTVFDDT